MSVMELYICFVFSVMILPSVYLVSPEEPRCFSRYDFEERVLEKSIKVEHKMQILQESVEKVLLELRTEKSAMNSDLSSMLTQLNKLSTEVKNEQQAQNEELVKLAESINNRTDAKVQKIDMYMNAEIGKKLTEIDEIMKQKQSQMSRISRDFTILTNETLSKMKDKKVAFSVSKPNSKLVDGVPIFTDIITNVGGGYNVETGQFTCPIAGLYLFSLTVMGSGSVGKPVSSYIRLNNVNKINVCDYPPLYDSGSASVIFHLKLGDRVDIGSPYGWDNVYQSLPSNVFNGLLITED